jgi:pimeloyl-ACP methyl ester carboxylesterase
VEPNTATVNGICLHYDRFASGGQPFVFSHGITDNGRCWWVFARSFEDSYDIITVDARGHGLSDAPEEDYALETHVEDLAGLIRALDLEKPILMGHSMGGAIVARLAAKYPAVPHAVILEDPVFMFDPPDRTAQDIAMRKSTFRAEIEERHAMTHEQLVRLCTDEVHPGWAREEAEFWAEAKQQVSPHIVGIFGTMPSLQESFSYITAPTLILKSDDDDATQARNREAAALLPDGKLVHVAGAGHNVRRDRPEATRAEVEAFLATLFS